MCPITKMWEAESACVNITSHIQMDLMSTYPVVVISRVGSSVNQYSSVAKPGHQLLADSSGEIKGGGRSEQSNVVPRARTVSTVYSSAQLSQEWGRGVLCRQSVHFLPMRCSEHAPCIMCGTTPRITMREGLCNWPDSGCGANPRGFRYRTFLFNDFYRCLQSLAGEEVKENEREREREIKTIISLSSNAYVVVAYFVK